jgi:hypothetical protein
VAIAAPYTVVAIPATTSTVLYTAPTAYQRDLILTNGGTAAIYVGGFTAVTAVTGFKIPAGASLLLTGATENVWGITSAGTTTMYVGQGSVVSVV